MYLGILRHNSIIIDNSFIFHSILFTTTFATSLLLAHVTCFRNFLSEIPNGESVPDPCNPEKPWPGVGHMNPQGGGTRNPFGRMFSENGKVSTVKDSQYDIVVYYK